MHVQCSAMHAGRDFGSKTRAAPGWLLCDVFDLAASQLQMLRQFIVSHPIVTSRLHEST